MKKIQKQYFFLKGRVALYTFLKALKLKKDDEIILPAFTCVVVANAIKYLDLKPIFLDIDPITLQYDFQELKNAINDETKAIICQNSFGYQPYYNEFKYLKEEYPHIYFIEDAAHAYGVKSKNDDFLDAKFYSMQWSKMITTGLGGILELRNGTLEKRIDDIYENELEELKTTKSTVLFLQNYFYKYFITDNNYMFMKKVFQFLYTNNLMIGSSSKEELNMSMPQNYLVKYPKSLVHLFNLETKKLSDNLKYRDRVSKIYFRLLKKYYLKLELKDNFGLLTFPILFKDKKYVENLFLENSIRYGDWFVSPLHPLTMEEIDYKYFNYHKCENSENICNHILNIPTNTKVGNIKKIIKIIKQLDREKQIIPWGSLEKLGEK